MKLLAKDIASKSNNAAGVEELALKHLNRTWNAAIEEAAKLAETSKGYPTEVSENIRKLKK